MSKLMAIGTARAEVDRGMKHLKGNHAKEANVQIAIDVPDGLTDDAIATLQARISNEALRFAQIAAVNLRDQSVAREDAERLKDVPAERPVTIVSPSNRKSRQEPHTDDDAVQYAWKDADGNIIPVNHPKRGAEAKRNIDRYTKAAKASPTGLPSRKSMPVSEAELRSAANELRDGGDR